MQKPANRPTSPPHPISLSLPPEFQSDIHPQTPNPQPQQTPTRTKVVSRALQFVFSNLDRKEQCPFCDKLCDRGINTPAGGAGGAHPCVCNVVGRTFRKPSQGTKLQLQPLAFAWATKLYILEEGVSISLSQIRVCRYLCRKIGGVDISVAN